MADKTENINNEEIDDDLENGILKTHELINHDLCGEIKHFGVGYSEVWLVTTQNMVVDELGLVHGGFIFCAADFAAMVAVNEKNVILATSNCQFLAPVKVGDTVIVKAKVHQRDGRKRNIEVEAFSYDIKIFTGLFKAVITEKHVLKLKLLETAEAI